MNDEQPEAAATRANSRDESMAWDKVIHESDQATTGEADGWWHSSSRQTVSFEVN